MSKIRSSSRELGPIICMPYKFEEPISKTENLDIRFSELAFRIFSPCSNAGLLICLSLKTISMKNIPKTNARSLVNRGCVSTK